MTPGLLSGLFSRGPSEQTVTELETRLETSLRSDEAVQHRLPGGGPLVHESEGRQGEHGTDASLAVVTDHRLLFVVADDGTAVLDVAHTDISDTDLDSGLFNTALTVETWEAGRYRFQPAGGETAAAVEYIERASDCWQFVETLLQELEGHAERIRTAIEEREFQTVAAVLEEAGETTDELDDRVAAAGLESALGERVAAARRNLQRTRVQTRRELARSLVDEAAARHLEEDPDYTGAYSRYDRAHEQLSTARAIAAEHDLEADAVEDALDRVERRLDRLARQPVGLAKQATERALGTDDPAVRVEITRAALGHYRDALTVAWGADWERPYDREELRYRIALLADGLVDARRAYATRLEATGDALAEEGDHERARERYRAAVAQLDAAVDTAGEFRTPDADPVERERTRVERKTTTTPH